MHKRIYLLAVLAALVPSLVLAGGGPSAAADPNSELALRLFAEREWARGIPAPYVFVYPTAGEFSAQALAQQNRMLLYWLSQPDRRPNWPVPPYWHPVYPMVWPFVSPWTPAPVPAR